jgi:hypothetical protein
VTDSVYTGQGSTQEQREEEFRAFHADQLRQQTKHLFNIQAILSVWLVLSILGAVGLVIAIVSANSSGY